MSQLMGSVCNISKSLISMGVSFSAGGQEGGLGADFSVGGEGQCNVFARTGNDAPEHLNTTFNLARPSVHQVKRANTHVGSRM